MSLQDGSRDGTRRMSTRNPRRRQRQESDSLQNQPRRKRSRITKDTYEAPEVGSVQNDAADLNGHAHGRRKSSTPLEALDMPLRGKKNAQKRVVKGDGSTVLVWTKQPRGRLLNRTNQFKQTQNAHYSLRHLPSTPDIIRNSASGMTFPAHLDGQH